MFTLYGMLSIRAEEAGNYMNNINKVGLILLVLLAVQANASITTYTCCINYTSNTGTILNSLDDISKWTITPAGTSAIGQDTIHYVEGSGSIWFNTGDQAVVQARQTSAINVFVFPRTNVTIGYWAWSENWSKVSQIKMLIYNTFPGSLNRSEWIVTNTSYSASAQTDSGWQYFTYNTQLFTQYSYNISNATIDLRMLVYPVTTATPANVSIDNIRFSFVARPKFFWDFDDGRMNVSKLAYPVLNANNQKGTIFVTINEISNGAEAIDLTNMTMLYANGWDVSSHGMDHVDLSILSNTSLISQLSGSYNYLNTHGFPRSASIIAYPVGYYNDNMLQFVKQYFLIGRTVNEAYFSADIQVIDPDTMHYRQTDSSIRDVAGIIEEINKTIIRNGSMHLLMHNVQNSSASYSLNYNMTDLKAVSDYLVTRSADIDVITYSDMLSSTTITDLEIYTNNQCRNYANTGSIGFSMILILIIVIISGAAVSALGGKSIDINTIVSIVVIIGTITVIGAFVVFILNTIYNQIGCI